MRSILDRHIDPSTDEPAVDPVDATLATYQATADVYAARGSAPVMSMIPFLDRLAVGVGDGRLLEIGSGPGCDADYLEGCGVRVTRTDATAAFVDRLRALGHEAYQLDIRTDALGGPWDGVLASAVLLHLTRQQFGAAAGRIADAVKFNGLFALTLKKGQGAGWTSAKVGMPRYFTYWEEDQLRAVLTRAGWAIESVDHVPGIANESWLYVMGRNRTRGTTSTVTR